MSAVVLAALGHRLREARLDARITIREAAAAADLRSHTTLVAYENGRVLPPLDRLAALANAYGVTIASLLVTHALLAPLVAHLDRRDPEQLQALVAALSSVVDAAETHST